MIKMVKFLRILLIVTLSLIKLNAQEHAASLGNAPVGFISRNGINGDRETYSSLGNAPVGVYQRQEYPNWGSYVLPLQPVYRPIYPPIYQPIFRPVFQPVLQEGVQTKVKVNIKPKPVVKIKVSKSISGTSPVKKVISAPNTPRGGLLGNLLGGGLLG